MILHKMMKGYALTENGDIDEIIAISDIQLAKDHGWYLLDINQCYTIFGDVNIAKLATKYTENKFDKDYIAVTEGNCFIDGYLKALEDNKNKLFTYDDMLQAIDLAKKQDELVISKFANISLIPQLIMNHNKCLINEIVIKQYPITFNVDIEKEWVSLGYDNIVEYKVNNKGFINIIKE